jgi:hypothetical protein
MAGDVTTPDHFRRQLCARAGASIASLLVPTSVLAEHIVQLGDFKAGVAKPFELKYDGYLINRLGTNRIASARMSFRLNGGRYDLSLTVDSFLADLYYQSEGRIDQSGLHPEIYRERRKVPFRREKTRQVKYVVSDDPRQINQRRDGALVVPPNTQDRVSLLVHFSLLAQTNPQLLEAGHDLAVPFARTKAVDNSRWRVGSLETAPSAFKDAVEDDVEPITQTESPGMQAQRIERVRGEGSKKLGVAFWLTNNAQRLPLVLQFSEKGRTLKFVWRA